MRKILWLSLLFLSATAAAQLSVTGLSTENQSYLFGTDSKAPRFSWQLSGTTRNIQQTAYEIKVLQDKKPVWQSGKQVSGQSVYITYQGTALESDTKYTWLVRVWDNQGHSSAWSQPAYFKTSLLSPTDWKAEWIEAGFAEEGNNRPAQYFRRNFSTGKKIKSATAYITALGMYEAELNGRRIGDAYLSPGWTSYNKRLQYQAYDVTGLLNNGANAIGVTLGNGWYRGYLAWNDNKDSYGKKTALLLQLMLQYTDGSREMISSDENWKCSTGPIRYSEIYHGETYDAREVKTGWSTAGYNADSWVSVKKATVANRPLIATYNEPIKKHERFKPVKIFRTPKGELVADFGQNLVGWVELKVKGQAGDQVLISHAEVLDKAGNFYIDNLRAAKQQNRYILKGGAEEFFEPHFTFQGFRYIKLEGFPGSPTADNLTAVALYSDMAPAGIFTSSNALINQLQHNIQWGQRGNFLDVPTDCPQRDERLGWTGDAQVFSRTASFNFNVHNFFTKWLKDVSADQEPNGSVPFVVPNVLGSGSVGSTGWADVATIVPWNMYLAYGDTKILEEQYASMKAWVAYMEKVSKENLWTSGAHFGDWLFYRPSDDNDGRAAVTDKYLIAQCFFAHSTDLVLKTATLLGKAEDIAYYKTLQESYPSWLYPVKMGATTIWERWDGQKPDSTFQTPGMNSFNHYAYGAIGDWMYRVAAGIDTKEEGAGYRQIIIHPQTGGNFTSMEASLKTNFGLVSSGWKLNNNQLSMDVTIPANTTASIYIPAADTGTITEGGVAISAVKDLKVSGGANGYVIVEAGSGTYHFEVKK